MGGGWIYERSIRQDIWIGRREVCGEDATRYRVSGLCLEAFTFGLEGKIEISPPIAKKVGDPLTFPKLLDQHWQIVLEETADTGLQFLGTLVNYRLACAKKRCALLR